MSKSKPVVEEFTPPVPDGSDASLGDVLEAIRTLTETVGELVKDIDSMRKEYKLKSRAGIFDQTGVK